MMTTWWQARWQGSSVHLWIFWWWNLPAIPIEIIIPGWNIQWVAPHFLPGIIGPRADGHVQFEGVRSYQFHVNALFISNLRPSAQELTLGTLFRCNVVKSIITNLPFGMVDASHLWWFLGYITYWVCHIIWTWEVINMINLPSQGLSSLILRQPIVFGPPFNMKLRHLFHLTREPSLSPSAVRSFLWSTSWKIDTIFHKWCWT
jgi:hypothetical protein